MRIQHNITAMNAYRNYNNNTSAIGKNLEKLSSGYKINRAGDDAAGLAVSQKMRLQISGLAQAQKNAKSGISYIQTAEGALQEVHEMLERMYTLAEQSANGTFDSDTDRTQLQKEVNNLMEEIDRIGRTANFNGMGIFAEYGGKTSTPGGDEAKTMQATATQDALKTLNQTEADSAFATGGIKITGLTDAITKVSIKTAAQETTGEDGKVTAEISDGTLSITLSRKKDSGSGSEVDDTKITAAIKTAITGSSLTADQQKALENVSFEGLENAAKLAKTPVTAVDITPAAAEADGTGGTGGTDGASGPTVDTTGAAGDLTDFGIESIDISSLTDLEGDEAVKVKIDADGTNSTMTITVGDTAYTFQADKSVNDLKGETITLSGGGKTITAKLKSDQAVFGNDKKTDPGDDVGEAEVGKVKAADDSSSGGGKGGGAGTITFWVGAEYSDDNKLTLQTMNLSHKGMQIGDSKVTAGQEPKDVPKGDLTKVDIREAEDAMDSLDIIKTASNAVSNMRGTLGAMQNRLDHTIKNLSVMQENMQDAESVIRDTDVADEMMAYTKNNILVQSAQAMLAQANQIPQGVLQLLQ